MAIEIRTIRSAPPGALERLFRESGFWPAETPDDAEYIRKVVTGSAVFAAAFDGDRLIGMGRAISDRISDAYIQDVAVDRRYRRQGIGGQLIRHLIGELRNLGVDWIGLVGVPGTEAFYADLGFEELRNHTAYKLSDPSPAVDRAD